MAHILLLLLLFSSRYVDSCLVVNSPFPSTTPRPNPDMTNCKCPPITYLDQDGIRNNTGGRYLANRQTWDPIVTAEGEDCFIGVTCKAVPGVSSFYTVLFRSNGSPIYINRVVDNQGTWSEQPRNIGNFLCAPDSNGTYQWMFHGSPIYDFSFACQADVDSCNCDPIKLELGVVAGERFPNATDQCGLIQTTCPAEEGSPELRPFFFSETSSPIDPGMWYYDYPSFYDDLTCIKDDNGTYDWYFFNIRLPEISLACRDPAITHDWPVVSSCGSFGIFNSTDDFGEYTIGTVMRATVFGKNLWTPSSDFTMTCEEGFDPVVFSDNNPMIILPKDNPFVTCTYNPLSNYLQMWVAGSVRVMNPGGACIKLETLECRCKPLNFINQDGIRSMEESAYMADLETYDSVLTVNSECEMELDVSSVPIEQFMVTIFRNNTPPLLMRRFDAHTGKPSNVRLSDLKCSYDSEDGEYKWFHMLNNMSLDSTFIAVQSNEGSCGCEELKMYGGGEGTVEKLNGACDVLNVTCPLGTLQLVLADINETILPALITPLRTDHPSLTVVGATCVNGNWYYAGMKRTNLAFLGYQDESYAICQCPPIRTISIDIDDPFKASAGLDSNATGVNGTVMEDIDRCEAELKCPEGTTGVILSPFRKPIKLSSNHMKIGCGPIPASSEVIGDVEHAWWVEGTPVSIPGFTCLSSQSTTPPPNPNMTDCKCPPIKYLNQEDIRNNTGGRYLANRQTWDPIVTSEGEDCSIEITCNAVPGVSSFYTVLFRSNGSPIYINRVVDNDSTWYQQPRNIGNLTCAADSNGTYQWMFHGSPIYDFSLACQADMDSCNCPELKVDPDVFQIERSFGTDCGFIETRCDDEPGMPERWPFVLSDDSFPFSPGMTTYTMTTLYDDLTCIKEDDGSFNWYFFNNKLPNAYISCRQPVDVLEWPSITACGSFAMFTSIDDFGFYTIRSDMRATVFGKNLWTPSSDFVMTCEDGFDPVVFSDNNPMIILSKDNPYVTCTNNPLSKDIKMWVAGSVRVMNPGGACIKLETLACPCTPPKFITQDKIRSMHLSEYMADLDIYAPELSVSEDCKLQLDVSSIPIEKFFFTIFQEHAPPLIMRRFDSYTGKPSKVEFNEMICYWEKGEYKWMHAWATMATNSNYAAIQSNEGSCECDDITMYNGQPGTIEKVNGACDVLNITCPPGSKQVYIANLEKPSIGPPMAKLFDTESTSVSLVGATCINKKWYYLESELDQFVVDCVTETVEYKCQCYPMVSVTINGADGLNTYVGLLTSENGVEGNITYYDSNWPCTAHTTCPDNTLPVIISFYAEPIVLSRTSQDNVIQCGKLPISANVPGETEEQWWVNGIPVSYPMLTCLT